MPTIRTPESHVEVYELGHFEQMQIDLALTFMAEYMDHGLQNRDLLNDLVTNLDADTLRGLMMPFRSHGTVTIIRSNPKD